MASEADLRSRIGRRSLVEVDPRFLQSQSRDLRSAAGIFGLREAGETCSKHRVERIMRLNKIIALHGYRTRHYSVGKPSVLIPNLVKRQFNLESLNEGWATDITYIRTWEGWPYLAVVMDLFSRKIVGWSTRLTIDRAWSSMQ